MKSQKGITLIALVITIIVMLILVAVSVTYAIQSGLFDKARDGANGWKTNQESEENLDKNMKIIEMSGDQTVETQLGSYLERY